MKKILCPIFISLLVSSCIFNGTPGVSDNTEGSDQKIQTFAGAGSGAGLGQAAGKAAGKAAGEASGQMSGYEGIMELPVINSKDVIIRHKGYTVSYNTDACIPEWVAYELTDDETRGDAEREDAIFQMDPQYRKTQAMREDYSGSGWTKGHMACAGDFHWDKEALDETFYLTNICPQDEELNKGDWNYLEKQIRYWARDNGKVWVVSGPIIGDNIYGTIGDRDVVVPDSFFKAVLLQKKGKYHSIAFVMDNDDKRYFLYDCSMTVNELEDLTGLDFFPELYDSVEESVESKIDYSIWNINPR